jgi:hypothetical protein
MTQLIRIVRAQLQLPWEPATVFPTPSEQVRREAVEALADLLREALSAEETEPPHQQEAANECEDHA